MKITNYISKKSIALNVHPSDKNEAIDMLVDLLMTAGAIKDKALVKRDILRREAQGSTGLANGLATPHAQNNAVKRPSISVITVPEGVEIDEVVVKANTKLKEGDVIATLELSSVLSTIASVQDEISELDEQLADTGNSSVSSSITAGVTGRLKKLYIAPQTDVASCMVENGALA